MIDKELIKQEIKKRKQLIWPTNTGEMRVVDTPKPFVQGWINALDWVLNIIDSLPEEHNEDLDEEIDRFKDWLNNFNQSDYPTSYTARDIARHFAEWQERKDTAMLERAYDNGVNTGKDIMKQQMMKDAVEGIVGGYTDIPAFINLEIEHKPNVKVGDEVKIVVLKTE